MSSSATPLDSELNLPIVTLRDAVVYPGVLMPFAAAGARAIRALESLEGDAALVGIAMQRQGDQDAACLGDVRDVGVVARVIKAAKSEDDSHAIVVAQGLHRIRFVRELARDPYLRASATLLADVYPPKIDAEFSALVHNVHDLAADVIAMSPTLPNELATVLDAVGDASIIADFAARLLTMSSRETRLELLEQFDVRVRLQRVYEELMLEREQLDLRRRIHAAAEAKIGKAQREFMLREQLAAIRRELGDAGTAERVVEELRVKIQSVGMNDAAKTEAERELRRLAHLPSESAESSVVRTYLDWLVSLPWQTASATEIDVTRSQAILDEDHWDLEKVKERIVEHLAVSKLRRDLKGPILCFVGPPGVGKTSVGKSIARASGRAFVRISLGGVHDEAEIRGHRRTYVGAIPGQIIQGIRRAGTRDPVFMLDEIDKLGKDFRGDPSAALMEALDPEQNGGFRDHYLDVPFDLSKVLFITTANALDTVPPALLDRMEVLELPGYSDVEKLQIAQRFLVPKQVAEHGLALGSQITFTDDGIRELISRYTREAGVRNLERSVGALCRKLARCIAAGEGAPWTVSGEVVRARLGVPRFDLESDLAGRTRRPGVAVGLAWTPQGGDILFVETTRMPRDRGEVTMTGHLGDVMLESAKTALSWVRASAARYGIPDEAFKQSDLHVHVPAGAVPKDGPSAGVVMATALVSLFTGRPVRPYLAMSGEITLVGELLPVGGIKEKLLAAKRSGVRELVLPRRNEPGVLEEIAPELREGITFHFVSTIEEAIDRALMPIPATRALLRLEPRTVAAK
jgi:ATP-dependent Lon protease